MDCLTVTGSLGGCLIPTWFNWKLIKSFYHLKVIKLSIQILTRQIVKVVFPQKNNRFRIFWQNWDSMCFELLLFVRTKIKIKLYKNVHYCALWNLKDVFQTSNCKLSNKKFSNQYGNFNSAKLCNANLPPFLGTHSLRVHHHHWKINLYKSVMLKILYR